MSSLGNVQDQDHATVEYAAEISRNETVVKAITNVSGYESVAQCALASDVRCLVRFSSAEHARRDINMLLLVMVAPAADVVRYCFVIENRGHPGTYSLKIRQFQG